ncbi:MAG: hypothetical protein EBX52_08070 [Proteobacteria bacterium]|nr:hypothetical protein [Pseudomonadota bacterium]
MSFAETIARHFQNIQVGILVLGGFSLIYYFFNRREPSKFRQREADRPDLDRILKQGPDSAQAKIAPKPRPAPSPPPLSLPGIRLNGAPHEILGVKEDATESEIMRAYKDAIKRFHPDTIQGDARDQIKFYQEASARINDAKNQMIKRVRG